MTTVGQLAGVADMVSRASSSAAAGLLGLADPVAGSPERGRRTDVATAPVVTPAPVVPATDDAYRSPYRLAGDELVLLDQRGVPERLERGVGQAG